MEEIVEGVKDFLLNEVKSLLPEFESEGITLPEFKDKAITHGAVDVSRIESPITVAILVNEQTEVDDDSITEHCFDTNLDVVFICSKATYSVLVSRACRYASALKKAMFLSPTFGGRFAGSGFGRLEIDYDAGAVAGQMTAASFNLTVRTDEL